MGAKMRSRKATQTQRPPPSTSRHGGGGLEKKYRRASGTVLTVVSNKLSQTLHRSKSSPIRLETAESKPLLSTFSTRRGLTRKSQSPTGKRKVRVGSSTSLTSFAGIRPPR